MLTLTALPFTFYLRQVLLEINLSHTTNVQIQTITKKSSKIICSHFLVALQKRRTTYDIVISVQNCVTYFELVLGHRVPLTNKKLPNSDF